MHSAPVRILVIDDNPDDRSLVIRQLNKDLPEAETVEIAQQADFDAALHQHQFQVVITDYALGWTDGLKVFNKVKGMEPDCAVIMFTGTGSEEVAVEAMKAGVDDYILKSPRHFSRLTSAVKQACKVARQRAELRGAERRYLQLFNSVPIGLFMAAPNGQILTANPAMVKMLAYPTRASLTRVSLGDLFEDRAEYNQWQEALERHGEVVHHEVRLQCMDGRICWVENFCRAVRDPKTHRAIYEGSVEDITERKLAELERENLISNLQEAIGKVKTLSGLLPICASCKKIRDDKGYWNQIEVYIQSHSEAEFTHSFCPECMRKLYPEVFAEPSVRFK
jgi:PAS domain S-box-containing protein